MNPHNKVKTFLDLAEVEYALSESGNDYKVKTCICCGNNSSNLEVKVDSGVYHCWACREGGSFAKLKQKLNAVTPERSAQISRADQTNLTEKAERLHQAIFTKPHVIQYLKARGNTEATIRKFKIGYEMIGGVEWISIPAFKDGTVRNIKYRGLNEKKWMQEKNAEKVLFNSDTLNNDRTTILVEGELKAMALDQVGIPNVVSLTGGVSTLPQEWIDLLKMKNEVIICLDSDAPGQQAAKEVAKRVGFQKCKNIVLPDAKDPDEYLFERKHTKVDFLELVKNATRFKVQDFFKGLKSAELIRPTSTSYLWHPYIPLGKLTMLEGDPGVGKSTLSLAIAAAVSNGHQPWWENLDYNVRSKKVIVFCGEDGAADTVVPRLRTLGANLENILIYDESIKFDEEGLKNIEAIIEAERPALVIFDPMVSFLGSKVDMNRANEMREPIGKVAKIAERNDCAALMIRHLGKSSKDQAIYRGLGSIDVAAAARSMLLVAKHPGDQSLRVMVHTKSNLTKLGKSVQFRLEKGEFSWAGVCKLEADDILYQNREADQNKIEKAKELLIKELGYAPTEFSHLKTQASQLGISERTLERAKALVGAKSRRVGDNGGQGAGHYEWYLESAEEIPDTDGAII